MRDKNLRKFEVNFDLDGDTLTISQNVAMADVEIKLKCSLTEHEQILYVDEDDIDGLIDALQKVKGLYEHKY